MIPFEDWRSEIVTRPPEMMAKDKIADRGGLIMAENKLKSCPFCGAPADISPVYALGGKYKGFYTVFCTNVLGCSASINGDECLDEWEAKAGAIERWNRRGDNDRES